LARPYFLYTRLQVEKSWTVVKHGDRNRLAKDYLVWEGRPQIFNVKSKIDKTSMSHKDYGRNFRSIPGPAGSPQVSLSRLSRFLLAFLFVPPIEKGGGVTEAFYICVRMKPRFLVRDLGPQKKRPFFFGPFLEKKDWFFPVLFFPIFAGLKKNWEK